MNSKAEVKGKLRHVVQLVVNVALNRLDFRTAAGNQARAVNRYNNFVRTVLYPKLLFDIFFFQNIWTFFFPSETYVGITNDRRYFTLKAKRTIFNCSFFPRAVPVEGTIY